MSRKASVRRVVVTSLVAVSMLFAASGVAYAHPTWWEIDTKSCNPWQYTNSNRVYGTQNIASDIDGWEATAWSQNTTPRVVYFHLDEGGNFTHKRGIDHAGVFFPSGSYAYCR
jgi:hypothetical protein